VTVGELLSRLTRSSPLGALLRRLYRERLTARGRYVFWLALIVGFVGIDTLQALVFIVFALAAGPLLVALVLALRPRPRVALRAAVPLRLTAGRSMPFRVGVSAQGARGGGGLVVGWGRRAPESRGLRFEPGEAYVTCRPDGEAATQLAVRAERRGRYVLPPLGVGRTDPLGLLSTRRVFQASQVVLAYPRFLALDELELPAGRRYQPGGIPLASSTGDATEFIGTRDYREGDPLRRIHWRSWARRSKPVVKEYQEEYFSRVALVLDTFLPRRPRLAERRAFEAAISLLASITDHMSRSEEVVDVLAAGPDLYEVSAGRSLGYLDNVLDVLACLLPCHEPPFEVLAPYLAERLARLTTVVAVVLDWDEGREAFLRRVRGMGAALRVFLVREGPTQRPRDALGEEFGTVTRVDPADLEQRLLAAQAEAMTPGRGRTVPAATIAPEPS
jgi:uncharacterized protein (DUF58 family)